MSEFPDKYGYDYIIFSASSSLHEEESLWLMDWDKVIKRMMFKRFNNYIQEKYLEKDGE